MKKTLLSLLLAVLMLFSLIPVGIAEDPDPAAETEAPTADTQQNETGTGEPTPQETTEQPKEEQPTETPAATEAPAEDPTEAPTEEPAPTPDPTEEPVVTEEPTEEPVVTEEPTAEPSEEPTPTPDPTEEPDVETETEEVIGGEVVTVDASFVSIDATFTDTNLRALVHELNGGSDDLSEETIGKTKSFSTKGQQIASFKGLELFVNLETLNLNGTKITTSEQKSSLKTALAAFTKLKELRCEKCELDSLDLSKNGKLEVLIANENKLTALELPLDTADDAGDYKNKSHMTRLEVNKNELKELSVKKAPDLATLCCEENKLKKLDVEENTKLSKIAAKGNKLPVLDLKKTAVTSGDDQTQELDPLTIPNGSAPYSYNLAALVGAENVGRITVTSSYTYDNKTGLLSIPSLPGTLVYKYDTGTAVPMTVTVELKLDAYKLYLNATNFPDANFRNWLIANLENVKDDGGQKYLEQAGVVAVTTINCGGQGIKNLKGIENFASLETLSCYNNELTELDLSKNVKLKTLDCAQNKLTKLDVTKCTELTTLLCNENQLTAIDVTTCTKLTALNVAKNKISAIDLKKNTALKTLNVSENELKALDVSKNAALTELNCAKNQLTDISFDKNTELKTLDCSGNQLKSLKVYYCEKLEEVICSDNQISAFGTMGNGLKRQPALKALDCSNNKLTDLNVASNPELIMLKCSKNSLKKLDVSANAKLMYLDCSENALTALDSAANVALENLNCSKNQLTALDVTKNTKLITLDCSSNKIKELDVSKAADLLELRCEKNELKSLKVDNNEKLTTLDCSGNQIAKLDLTDSAMLQNLNCAENALLELDLSKNTKLNTLDCSKNQLTALDVSKCTALKKLTCDGNAIPMIDLGATAVTELKADQTIQGQVGKYESSKYTFDLTKLVDKSKIANVSVDASVGTIDTTTGIITFTKSVTTFDYTYKTGKGNMKVSVGIVFENDPNGNVVYFEASDLPNGSTVEVDGVPYAVTSGNSVVLPASVKAKVVTEYTYKGTDPHTNYPIGMRVWIVETKDGVQTAKHIKEFDNILQYAGSSIRITGVKGIRMITGVPKDKKSTLINKGISGFKLTEYGTILAWDSDLGSTALTKSFSKVKSGYAYKKGAQDAVFKTTGGVVQYTNVLVGFSDAQCSPELSMRPYMTLEKDGEQYIIYGGVVHRSIGYIAYQNRAAFKPKTESYEYIWNIIHVVYGTAYDSEYVKP